MTYEEIMKGFYKKRRDNIETINYRLLAEIGEFEKGDIGEYPATVDEAISALWKASDLMEEAIRYIEDAYDDEED